MEKYLYMILLRSNKVLGYPSTIFDCATGQVLINNLPMKIRVKAFASLKILSEYENNLREPKRETISQFAKLYNVSTDYLHGHTNDKFSLTQKDKMDIKNSLEQIKSELSTDETILFDGEPMCPEAIESLLAAMEIGLSLVKQRQKKDKNI